MKVAKVLNSLVTLFPMMSVVIVVILFVNLVGHASGKPGGLTTSEFDSHFLFALVLTIITISWYSLLGIVLKKNPYKLWKKVFTRIINNLGKAIED